MKKQCIECGGIGLYKTETIICRVCDGIKCIQCGESGYEQQPYETCVKCDGSGNGSYSGSCDSSCNENNHCTQSHDDSDQEAEDDAQDAQDAQDAVEYAEEDVEGDSECEDDNCTEDDDCPEDDYKCKEFILDFSNCRHKGDAFKLFRKVIGFIGFGYSLDSLVDILRGDYGHFTYKDNVLLRIRGRQNAEINIPDWAKIVEIMSLRKKVKVQFEDDECISDMPDWDTLVEII